MGFSGWIDGKLAEHNSGGDRDPKPAKPAPVDTVALKDRMRANLKDYSAELDRGTMDRSARRNGSDYQRFDADQKQADANAAAKRITLDAQADTLVKARNKK